MINRTLIDPQARRLRYAGIPSEKFNFIAAGQKKSQWCWAASLQMIYNYYGVKVSQEEIVRRSYGADPRTGALPDWPGSFNLITHNINGEGIDNNRRQYTVNAYFQSGAPEPNSLLQELYEQRPVLIGYKTSSITSHAVVITACSYLPTIFGNQIQTLTVRDPGSPNYDISNPCRVEYPGKNLAELIDAHWYIRIR